MKYIKHTHWNTKQKLSEADMPQYGDALREKCRLV